MSFPTQAVLGITVEILLNTAWVDISNWVYQRDDISVSGGQSDESSSSQPAQCTMTLQNTDGRFSPNNTSSPYYPYLVRNVQIRVSVNSQSATGVNYFGYRFWGVVASWPPTSDISGQDIYVQITANGPLRQAVQGGGTGSALTRYYGTLTGMYAPIAYWPCEEDPDTLTLGAGIDGGQPMLVTTVAQPIWKANNSFNGSAPIPVINQSTWDGLTGSFNSSGDDIYNVAGTYIWVAPVSTVNCKVYGAGGGGANGWTGCSGAGGEFAQETTLAVTIGNSYLVTVGTGGSGGHLAIGGASQANQGGDGGLSSFPGDSVPVIAHGGSGGGLTVGGTAGGGTGSTNTVHENGGNGSHGLGTGATSGGASGGSSAGTAAAGNNGNAGTGTAGGATTTAPTGGSVGGSGGFGNGDAGVASGGSPGGGGGAGSRWSPTNANHSGQPGGSGRVELIYTPATVPTNNVIRFALQVPAHGGNNGRVLMRIHTSGTFYQIDVMYATGGNIFLKVYNVSLGVIFTSGNLNIGDGQEALVSVEIGPNGTSLNWLITACVPGATTLIGIVSGTRATSTIGNVTEVLVSPNEDITQTSVGHISVQYALIPLLTVSSSINAHASEMSIDRFIRLANEQALAVSPKFNETADHWSFEGWTFTVSGTPVTLTYFIVSTAQASVINIGDTFSTSLTGSNVFTVLQKSNPFAGFVNVFFQYPASTGINSGATVTSFSPALIGGGTMSWVATNSALTQSTVTVQSFIYPNGQVWPSIGFHSLLITASGGAGLWGGGSPIGTSGQAVMPGDIVSVGIDVYAPAALGAVQASIIWYNSAGTLLSTTTAVFGAMTAGQVASMFVTGPAPTSAAYFSVQAADNETTASGTLLYIDNVRITPRMGVQSRGEYTSLLKEIQTADQGILKELKNNYGLGYSTRISIINQSPVCTLDASLNQIAAPLAPVLDEQLAGNVISVKRYKGSTVTVTQNSGTMSVQAPPAGVGVYKKKLTAVLENDEQLAALAAHILLINTSAYERYPQITLDMTRTAVANLFNAIPAVDIGDYIEIINLPFWYPNTTAQQMVIGYTELINAYKWTITWNCKPYEPYIISVSSVRRW